MGIITNPGYDLWGDDNPCFEAGKTPKKLYACFTGIEIGDGWGEGLGYPLGGQWALEQVDTMNWHSQIDAAADISFHLDAYYASVMAETSEGFRCFEKTKTPGCKFSFANLFQNPLLQFYGGFCNISVREDMLETWSIKKICDLCGIDPDIKTFAELSADDAGVPIIRLARQKDGTCLRIKF